MTPGKKLGAGSFAVAALCVAVVVAQGCSERAEFGAEPPNPSIANLDIVVCGTLPPRVQSDGTTRTPREWYSLTAINGTLKNFPRFAQFAGVETVSDCAGARDAIGAYEAYRVDHPGFDDNKHIEDVNRPTAGAPPPDSTLVPKLGFGPGVAAGDLAPVVLLQYVDPIATTDPSNPTIANCTGSFIAKNWIVTAAHCLDVIDTSNLDANFRKGALLNPGTTIVSAWVDYQVTLFNSAGNPASTTPYVALQYADPNYMGYYVAKSNDHDIALLYISDADDARLAPGPGDPMNGQGPWLRIALSGIPTYERRNLGGGRTESGRAEIR